MDSGENTPQLIGRYELLTRLATGGMAELFLARERGLAGLERLVVVKRILPHLADQPSFVEMFLREARIVARLSHPNVVQIYELGQQDRSYHIAMEYIHGSTVREMLLLAQKGGRAMPLDVTVSVVDQACRGLHAAHELKDLDGQELGLVHRDISPHNLMCTTAGHVKLLDFGVAKSTSANVEATYSGNLKGKFAYLSPEQCRHEPLDRRSDVFAMGIVLWEMLTMRLLFKRKTELDMMQAVIEGKVPPPSRFREEVPEAIGEVVYKALATDRDERYDSAKAMRLDLMEAARRSGIEPDEGRVADFLEGVAGETLAERRQTVEHACERELTRAERRQLLHMTGGTDSQASHLREGASADGATVVERPGGTGGTPAGSVNEERTRQSSPQRLEEMAESDRERSEVHDTEKSSDGGAKVVRVLVAAAVTLIIGGALVAWLSDSDEEEEEGPEVDIQAVYGAIEVDGEPITLGWAPTIDLRVLSREVAPLHAYLEHEMGRPVPKVLAESYTDLSRMLRQKEVEAAMLPPALYVLTSEIDDSIELLVMRESDGTASSDGHLLVRRGGEIEMLDDLEGETFCFVDAASTSGHLLPRHYIRRQGHDPDEFVGEVHWSGDHFQGMRDLIEGKCEAAAVYSGAYLSADEYDIRTGQMSTLALTGRLPQDVIAVHADMSDEDRELLKEAMLGFDPQREFGIDRLGVNQRMTGFRERNERNFDQLRDIVGLEGLSIEDL